MHVFISNVAFENLQNKLSSNVLHELIYMNCCPIVSTQEVEIDIILGTLTVWTTFHVEQNLLNLLFFRPQLLFGTIWMKI